ncbi:GNAT family N-acetyltransferase [Leucothrix arctica]|uniref:N-alpha-acetyltransferase 40 n=1 Tax=Leucothrix arctica TaxID=1481894 RepID=A0A317CG00_9GAMM|nr:GNAT family N-acetyltransferase [Leucothrix arctica]PWQ97488.1 hypothetical protein DKT75_06065 [Leucothrix arctica]
MSFIPSNDFETSLNISEQLMLGYYQENDLEWKRQKRYELLATIEHFHITREGAVAGFFAYAFRERHLYLYDLQILPEYQSQGLGSSIMRHLMTVAESTPLKTIKLCVFKSNTAAYNFYMRLGFEFYEELNVVYRLIYRKA